MKSNKYLLYLFFILSTSVAKAQNWQLVWADEFTTGISSDWVFETGGGGWGNNELEYYRQENATVSNGQLVITAKHESFGGMNYTSARMKTQGKRSWKFGKIVARIAIPSFQGIWPAFWMLGDNIGSVGWPSCGEIDIMEHVNTGGAVYGTVHWSDPNGAHASYSNNTTTTVTAFHDYSVEWDTNFIRWFVDGVKFHEINIAGGINGTSEFQNNFFILLNLAVGGNWPGNTIDNNGFPANMYVDYVRVYQDAGTASSPVTVYNDCNYGGTSAGLQVGNYTLSQLQAKGIANDAISSVKVQSGYQIRFYQNDNYGGSSILKTADDACLVDDNFNDAASSVSVTKVNSFSQTIQAESYSSMAGVQTETTTDAGGGLDVGWIDTNDWMAYNSITVPTTGSYTLEYRVASVSGGTLSADLNAGSTVLGTVSIPATGGWQNWTTVSKTVTINAGTYNFGIFAATGGWNLNWWRISGASGARTTTIAESTNAAPEMPTLEIYPNPATTELNIVASEEAQRDVRILGANGAEVFRGAAFHGKVDIASLPGGMYIVHVSDKGRALNRKFMKK